MRQRTRLFLAGSATAFSVVMLLLRKTRSAQRARLSSRVRGWQRPLEAADDFTSEQVALLRRVREIWDEMGPDAISAHQAHLA